LSAIFEVSVTVVVVCVPVPLSRMLCEPTPVPPKTTDPLATPGAEGRKAMFCVQLAFGARVIGTALQEPPVAVVKEPVNAIEATVSEAEPVFARMTLCDTLGVPTPSLAKVKVGRTAMRSRSLVCLQ
jgi:hypothetical protein